VTAIIKATDVMIQKDWVRSGICEWEQIAEVQLKRQRSKPGAELRLIRQQLGLSFRDVHAASLGIAEKHRQTAFVISPSRLHRIETKKVIPGIHRLYALARIYGRTLNEILSLYGIPLRRKNGSPRPKDKKWPLLRSNAAGTMIF
jgi:transcriptional regulator with XRE-family HTH domain